MLQFLQKAIFYPDKFVRFDTIIGGKICLLILPRRIEMKTLITALAITAMLAIPAIAKTERTRAAHVQPNHVLSHNSVSHNPAAQLKASSQIRASYCHFHDGETDPDSQVRLYMVRDCREHENGDEWRQLPQIPVHDLAQVRRGHPGCARPIIVLNIVKQPNNLRTPNITDGPIAQHRQHQPIKGGSPGRGATQGVALPGEVFVNNGPQGIGSGWTGIAAEFGGTSSGFCRWMHAFDRCKTKFGRYTIVTRARKGLEDRSGDRQIPPSSAPSPLA
jgi:hypothetical protein